MVSRSRTDLRAVVAAVTVLAVLGGCTAADGANGGDGGAPPPPAADADDRVEVTGLDNLAWEPEELSARPGAVEVVLTCGPRVNHNIVIGAVEVAACRPGETRSGVVELQPGAHEFVCTVPGHSSLMRGILTVEG